MDKTKDWDEELRQEHGKLKWIANVEKDDESVRLKGHIVGPPKADDQYSAEKWMKWELLGSMCGFGKTRNDPVRKTNRR